MNDQMRGITIALALVAVAALLTAFGSSLKAKGASRQIGALRGEIEKLTQTKNTLEAELHQTKERYDQETALSKNLKETLFQEQAKNQTLAEEVERQQQKLAQERDAETTTSNYTTSKGGTSKATASRNFSGKSR